MMVRALGDSIDVVKKALRVLEIADKYTWAQFHFTDNSNFCAMRTFRSRSMADLQAVSLTFSRQLSEALGLDFIIDIKFEWGAGQAGSMHRLDAFIEYSDDLRAIADLEPILVTNSQVASKLMRPRF